MKEGYKVGDLVDYNGSTGIIIEIDRMAAVILTRCGRYLTKNGKYKKKTDFFTKILGLFPRKYLISFFNNSLRRKIEKEEKDLALQKAKHLSRLFSGRHTCKFSDMYCEKTIDALEDGGRPISKTLLKRLRKLI